MFYCVGRAVRAGDGWSGEHDGRVRLDRLAGAVEDRSGLQFGLGEAEELLGFPQGVIGGHDRISDHRGRLDVGDVALVAGGLAGPLD